MWATKKRRFSFVCDRCFLSKQLHEIISCTTTAAPASAAVATTKEDSTSLLMMNYMLHSIILSSSSLALIRSLSLYSSPNLCIPFSLTSARAHQFPKHQLNVDSWKRMSISLRSAFFGRAAAFFCVESLPLYRPSFAKEKKRNTILHTVSHIIFHILIWTRMYLNIR